MFDDLTLKSALDGLNSGQFSASELVEAHISKLEALKPLNLLISETFDQAMDAAKQSDQNRKTGETGALEGLPIANKDLFCTEGVLTTAASKILNNFIPPYESTVSNNLKQAGAISLGKTNLDEFAMGSTNSTSYFGAAQNPWRSLENPDQILTPGGSSGGSAAIVAAEGVLAATGTDTGGSIRQPAALCGIVGMKPTYGRCSRWGIVAFASSLDQAGPMTKTVGDAALMLEVMAGHDPKDSTSADLEVEAFSTACTQSIKGLKIGIPTSYRNAHLSESIGNYWDKTADWLVQEGAELVEIALDYSDQALPAYYIIAPAEASSNLARYDGVRYGYRAEGVDSLENLYNKTRGEGFGAEVKRRIMIGTYVLSAGYYDAYYRQAQKVRSLIARDFEMAYQTCDVILAPTTPTPAFALEDEPDDPVTVYLNDIYTVPVNLAGLPAISLPVGLDGNGLPLGMQLIGRAFDEMTLFKAAAALERCANFTHKPQMIRG